eukprot:Phypoly_transcript_10783.p1 GENE.Phypoly_transcript_10783~~Phypoly_transcript_10783.p1  ORF type:complete len:282 (+),score=32.97 Phypoly_transcript_10783:36-848(+)
MAGPTLSEYAVQILTTKDADEKSRLTKEAVEKWNSGQITQVGAAAAPSDPGRPDNVKIIPAGKMPKRGAGTLANRIALLHSLVHIENVAIDLTWDIMVRFTHYNMPKGFYDNFVKIAGDECKHYTLLNDRLKELGSYYGELPAHAGLWESAMETAHDLYARLAIEHMVHEARGLDVTPKTIEKFRNGGDEQTATLLEDILKDEITHVTAGLTWFTYLCEHSTPPKPTIPTFTATVRAHFRGLLKPPFNTDARLTAGMTEDWYLPLTLPAQ